MAPEITVKVTINSACEDALSWKCCNLHGMNLEIQVTNKGVKRVYIRSEAELIGDDDQDCIEYLFPHGMHVIAPDQALSFYCSYDEQRFQGFSHIIVTDEEGVRCRASITGSHESTEADAA